MFMTREELQELLGSDTGIRNAAENRRYQEVLLQNGLDPDGYYQEISMSSPYVNTHRDITYQYQTVTIHSHAFYEILCCRTSCGAEYLVGSQRYALQKGDIILIRPGVSHCVILPNPLPIPYERDLLWLSESFLKIYAGMQGLPMAAYEKDLSTYLIRTANTPWEYLADLLHHGVKEEERKQFGWQTGVAGNTLLFLTELQRAYQSRSSQYMKAEKPDLLDQIIAHIEDHYREKLSLGEIAGRFYVSERTVSGLFRQRLGVSFHQFLTQRRLIAAKSLILAGVDMESVCFRSGFSDYSAFFRAFKTEFGVPPREFKKLEEQKNTLPPI